jgi:uncharacterized protein
MRNILVGFLVIVGVSAYAQKPVTAPAIDSEAALELNKWRKETEESLKKNWLTVVALDWLKEGENLVGSGESMSVRLPKAMPKELGNIRLKKGGMVEIEFATAKNVKLNGQTVAEKKSYILLTDKTAKKSIVEIGKGKQKVQFYLIERPNGIGVRVKDSNSQTLKNFRGLRWFDVNPEFIVNGTWKKFPEPRVLRVPDILGNSYDESITGSVIFKLNNQSFELFPTRKGDELFFVFRDQSSGKETYGTGRFLEARVEKDNRVVLDFNRAYNPPCGQIKFATCPMPPLENKLNVSILAGEMSPATKH